MSWEIRQGDALPVLREMPAESVQTCVTSPPYWGLRDYGTAEWEGGDSDCDHRQGRPGSGRADGIVDERMQRNRDGAGAMGGDCRCGAKRIDSQLGLEPTPEQYVANLVAVFREVRRVLRVDGSLWLNLGDSFSGKQLTGVPWRVAFALQADGWWLRSDIIWAKPNPMPESVTDRPTRAHEYIFLLTKSARYFYDADAIREEPHQPSRPKVGQARHTKMADHPKSRAEIGAVQLQSNRPEYRPSLSNPTSRNRRSVWTVTTQPYPDAHFATFPPKLIEPCILAGSPPKCCGECGAPWERVTEKNGPTAWKARKDAGHPMRYGDESGKQTAGRSAVANVRPPEMYEKRGGLGWVPSVRTVGWRPTCTRCLNNTDTAQAVVLDPFAGSGTTGVVALRYDRSFIGIELNPTYCEMARNRIRDDAPLLNVQLEAA